MSNTLIIAALLWLSSMVKHGSFSSTLPTGYRIQASLLTLFLVYGGVADMRILGWSLFHPHWFLDHYWQSAGFFPPGISSAIVILSLLASVVGLAIGIQITQRKLQGFNLAVRCAPFLLLIALLDYTRIIGTQIFPSHAAVVQELPSPSALVRRAGQDIVQNHAKHAQKVYPTDVIVVTDVILIALIIAFYFWLYRFAKSPKNRAFIKQDSPVVTQPIV